MTDKDFYHAGHRKMQDHFQSRRIADRLQTMTRSVFSEDDKAFVQGAIFFFFATCDAAGRPDCSFKGGPAGFVKITGPSELSFPDYDGNGMFRSLGNILINPNVGLLFIAMEGKRRRLRVNGRASIQRDDELTRRTVGAQSTVKVEASSIFPNCSRYIPAMQFVEPSIYTPIPGCDPIEPEWKSFDAFKEVMHPRQPTWKG